MMRFQHGNEFEDFAKNGPRNDFERTSEPQSLPRDRFFAHSKEFADNAENREKPTPRHSEQFKSYAETRGLEAPAKDKPKPTGRSGDIYADVMRRMRGEDPQEDDDAGDEEPDDFDDDL